MFSDTKFYIQSSGDDNYRRSIYTFLKRSMPPPFMTIFDAPSRHTCNLKRNISNTPLQALVLLNDQQFTETHEVFFERVKDIRNEDERLKRIYKLILKREPAAEEKKMILNSIKSGIISWTTTPSIIMNLDEFISIE